MTSDSDYLSLEEHLDGDCLGARSYETIRKTKRLWPEVACTEITDDAIARDRLEDSISLEAFCS